MNRFYWRLLAISVIIINFSQALARDHREEVSEDLKFIRQWRAQQTAAEVAERLALTQTQVQQLRDMKSACDRILEASKTQRQQIEAQRDAAAGKLRASLEETGQLDSSLEREIAESQRALRKLREKTKLELRLATLDLIDLLTPDQLRALKEHQRDKMDRGVPGKTGRDAHHRPGPDRKRQVARFLLSDAFLNQFP